MKKEGKMKKNETVEKQRKKTGKGKKKEKKERKDKLRDKFSSLVLVRLRDCVASVRVSR